MNHLIAIGTSEIRQRNGLYSINDLHTASGGEAKNKPSNWLANRQTQELIDAVSIAGIPAILKKQGVGTFVCRELVIAYAAWISAAFHLKVIRVFLDTQTPARQTGVTLTEAEACAVYGALRMADVHLTRGRLEPVYKALRALESPYAPRVFDLYHEVGFMARLVKDVTRRCQVHYDRRRSIDCEL